MPNLQRKRNPKTKSVLSPAAAAVVTPRNQAEAYGVTITAADVTAGSRYWQVVSVRHLPAAENKGRRNIYIDALDESSQRCRESNLRIGWTWEGRGSNEQADPKLLDKPDNEPAGNIDIDKNQHIEAWIVGDGLPSDHVLNLRTDHPDEPGPNGENWNSLFHHSFHVIFQRTRKVNGEGTADEIDPPPSPLGFRFEVWPTESRVITQRFGENPAIYKKYDLAGHEGIDIVASEGSKIFCVAAGKVKLAHQVDDVPYGIHVRVEHSDGYETIYGHMKEIFVAQDSPVAAGQLLGLADHTGNVIGDPGDHLHLSLKQRDTDLPGYPGHFIDPMPFLQSLLNSENNLERIDNAQYVSDRFSKEVQLQPNQTVTQSWTMRNNGTTSWGEGYKLVFQSGARMAAAVAVAVPATAPDGEATIPLDFQTPTNPGHYRSDWQMQNSAGQRFGDRLWFEVEVIAQPQPQISSQGNKLGFYIQSSQGVHDWISTVKPPVILIHAWDQGLLEEIRHFRSPNTFVIGRMDYIVQDGQKMAIDQSLVESWLDAPDPAAHGRALAEHILNDNFNLAQRTVDGNPNSRHLVDAWMSLNECVPGPNSDNYQNNPDERVRIEKRLRAYDQFQVAFRNKLLEHNIEAIAFNFGAGNFGAAEHYLRFFPETLRTYTYLGFHEYGWPALSTAIDAQAASSAGTYRAIVTGLSQATGRSYRVVISEAGLARMYKHPNDGVGDVGWLNQQEPISQDNYWRSLTWYNDFINQDQNVVGACLFQVGHTERWVSFRHLGNDHLGQAINLLDRIAALSSAAQPAAPASAAALPLSSATEMASPKPLKISGTVIFNGKPLAGANVYLIGSSETIGSLPGAALYNSGAVTWTRQLARFSGTIWHCWRKEVANQVAGISWQEFKRLVCIYNPQLAKSSRLHADQHYFLPENRTGSTQIVWDRTITGFAGNLWRCWQTFVANRVVGINYQQFKRAILRHNPHLTADHRQFYADQHYTLPRNQGDNQYAIQTQSKRQGQFTFDNLPPGSYQLEVRAADALPFNTGFSCVDDLSLEIVLQSKFLPSLAMSAAVPLPSAAASIEAHPWVGVAHDEFVVNGKAFRFIGVNIRGLIHYGDRNAIDGSSEVHRLEQLQAAYEMGARVVRVFLPCMHVEGDVTIQRFHAVLNLVRQRFPGLYILPAFTNLYGDVPFRVRGDDSFYDRSLDPGYNLLNASFFEGRYNDNYLPFVRQVVTTFRDEPIIFAWEVGNELKLNPLYAPDTNDPHLTAFMSFMRTAAQTIQNIDQRHLITTGMNSTHHASLKDNGLGRQLYNHFDFVTMHCYNEEYENDDSELAKALGKPYIVEEAGFDSARFGEDRSQIMQREVDKWFNLQARGYMPWGFMGTSFDMGDGDDKSGFDRSLHHDWEQLYELFHRKAEELSRLDLPLTPIERRDPTPLPLPSLQFTAGDLAYCVAQNGLNLRNTAGLGGNVIMMMKLGDAMTITGLSQSKDGLIWWPVRREIPDGGNIEGWVAESVQSMPLLGKTQPALPAAAAVPPPDIAAASVSAGAFTPGQTIYAQVYVNLRQDAGYIGKTDGDVIGQIVYGSPVEVLAGPLQADALTWWQVRAPLSDNQVAIGWVAEKDGSGVQLVGNQAPVPPPPFTGQILGTAFKIGDRAAVVAPEANIRRSPGYIGQSIEHILTSVARGTVFTLHSGPQMMDGLEWWQVAQEQSVKGWMAVTDPYGIRLLALQSTSENIHIGKPFHENWLLTQGWGSWPGYYSQYKYDGVALKGHNGLDFGTAIGTPILAVDAGEVIKVDFEPIGFGNHLLIRHAWGESLYAHLQRVDVGIGTRVAGGQSIGLSGESGLQKSNDPGLGIGPHLHFGIRIFPYRRTDGWGGFVDPSPFMQPEDLLFPAASAAALPTIEPQPAPMAPELPGRARP